MTVRVMQWKTTDGQNQTKSKLLNMKLRHVGITVNMKQQLEHLLIHY